MTRTTGTTADYLLVQLTELAQRRARRQDVDARLSERLTALLDGLMRHPMLPSARATVQGGAQRLADAWQQDAIRLVSRRDIEQVRSFLSSIRLEAQTGPTTDVRR